MSNNCACAVKKLKPAFVKQGMPFFKCPSCGLVSIGQDHSQKELKDIYNKQYYSPWNIDKEEVFDTKTNKSATFSSWINSIEKYSSKGKILDVGCAMGFFLEEARKRGWDTFGVELSEYSSGIARNKFGANIFTGKLEEARFPEKSFDAATMFDLLEHVQDPAIFMKEVSRILKPGGLIVISTMDTKSLSAKVMGKNWPHFKPEHLCYFSSKNIADLLSRAGFSILETSRAKKTMNLNYVNSYFGVYRLFPFTQILKCFCALLPKNAKKFSFNVSFGEMFVIARKNR